MAFEYLTVAQTEELLNRLVTLTGSAQLTWTETDEDPSKKLVVSYAGDFGFALRAVDGDDSPPFELRVLNFESEPSVEIAKVLSINGASGFLVEKLWDEAKRKLANADKVTADLFGALDKLAKGPEHS